jgi:hypothetical protein
MARRGPIHKLSGYRLLFRSTDGAGKKQQSGGKRIIAEINSRGPSIKVQIRIRNQDHFFYWVILPMRMLNIQMQKAITTACKMKKRFEPQIIFQSQRSTCPDIGQR